MVDEVVELLGPAAPGVVIDATLGGGGHSAALLAASAGLRILAIDRDPDAIERVPVDTRVRLVTANFGDLGQVLAEPATRGWIDEPAGDREGAGGVVGVLFDLGVSSHQLDRADRGFSYHGTGPLDMRMGPDAGRSAADIVNTWDATELAQIFRRFGEERYARRIADRIVADRPFADTTTLAESVAGAVPAPARRHGHPARRVFQAIRIAVNDELTAVADGLDAAIAAVDAGGRIVTIAYHSLEDRIVKRRFTEGARGCICPPELPVCVCDPTSELRRLTRKARRPSAAEIATNPRARSARLRAVEKLDSPEVSGTREVNP
jgi:16S rRNA (cytosine1402-N4)-methyltransferase